MYGTLRLRVHFGFEGLFSIYRLNHGCYAGNRGMKMMSAAACHSFDPAAQQQQNILARLGPPEFWLTTGRFRFVPLSYLSQGCVDSDSGLAELLYLRSLISDEADD